MILLMALTVAVLFGAGAFLLLERDLVRMAGGTLLVSEAAILFVMGSGLQHGEPPLRPVASAEAVSDPLVQALALTAVVISFAVTGLLLALVLRVERTHGTIDVEEVKDVEEEAEDEEENAAGEERRPEGMARGRGGEEA